MAPQPGDFACRNMGGVGGRLISFGEWLNGDGFGRVFDPDNSGDSIYYDHAEIFVGMADHDNPYGYTMGAYPGGARLVPLYREQQENGHGFLWSTGKLDLTDVQRQRIVYNAKLCKGIGYSFADYFALFLHRLDIPMPGLRKEIADSKTMICSQLVDWCYMTAGIHLFNDGRWPGYVTPADLANLILAAS